MSDQSDQSDLIKFFKKEDFSEMKKFSIVIVSLNGEKALPVCIEALKKTNWENFEVILVDNGSSDSTSDVVRELWSNVKIIRVPENLGFAGGNNVGIKEAKGDWVVLLNDDTEVDAKWLRAFDKTSDENPDAGILGCKLLYPNSNIIQHAGCWIEPNGLSHHYGYGEEDKGQHNKIRECEYVTGAAFAISRKVINKIGILDAKFFPIYFEEIDYCKRAQKAGFKILYVPDSVVIHHESRTTTKFSKGFLIKYHKNRMRYLFKNKSPRELLAAFKHEAKWLIKHKPADVYTPLLRAYFSILFQLPEIIFKRIIK